jgi:hypothetical protein
MRRSSAFYWVNYTLEGKSCGCEMDGLNFFCSSFCFGRLSRPTRRFRTQVYTSLLSWERRMQRNLRNQRTFGLVTVKRGETRFCSYRRWWFHFPLFPKMMNSS